jgi:hypothetical protein
MEAWPVYFFALPGLPHPGPLIIPPTERPSSKTRFTDKILITFRIKFPHQGLGRSNRPIDRIDFVIVLGGAALGTRDTGCLFSHAGVLRTGEYRPIAIGTLETGESLIPVKV